MDAATYLSAIQAVYASHGAPLTLPRGASATSLLLATAALQDDTQDTTIELNPTLASLWALADGGPSWYPLLARPAFSTGYELLSVAEALREREGMAARAPQYERRVRGGAAARPADTGGVVRAGLAAVWQVRRRHHAAPS